MCKKIRKGMMYFGLLLVFLLPFFERGTALAAGKANGTVTIEEISSGSNQSTAKKLIDPNYMLKLDYSHFTGFYYDDGFLESHPSEKDRFYWNDDKSGHVNHVYIRRDRTQETHTISNMGYFVFENIGRVAGNYINAKIHLDSLTFIRKYNAGSGVCGSDGFYPNGVDVMDNDWWKAAGSTSDVNCFNITNENGFVVLCDGSGSLKAKLSVQLYYTLSGRTVEVPFEVVVSDLDSKQQYCSLPETFIGHSGFTGKCFIFNEWDTSNGTSTLFGSGTKPNLSLQTLSGNKPSWSTTGFMPAGKDMTGVNSILYGGGILTTYNGEFTCELYENCCGSQLFIRSPFIALDETLKKSVTNASASRNFEVGNDIFYQLDYTMPKLYEDVFYHFGKLEFKDTLPQYVTPYSIQVLWNGSQVAYTTSSTSSQYVTASISGQTITVSATSWFLSQDSFYNNQNFRVVINGKAKNPTKGVVQQLNTGTLTFAPEFQVSDTTTLPSSTVSVKINPLFDIDTSIEHGSITPSESGIKSGSNRTVTWSADAGYYVESVKVDGVSQSVSNRASGSYTFSDIQKDHTVDVVCKPCYKITTSAVNGTITNTVTGIMPGADRTITWSANPGYYVKSVSVDGRSIAVTKYGGDSYTFTNIQDNHTVDVVCEPCYKIVTSINHGTITDDALNVMPHSDKTITWTAASGYYVESVTVDGVSQPVNSYTDGSYEFSDVQRDHTVDVVCKPCYKITTQIMNGRITDSILNIMPASEKSVSWQAKDGYFVESITIDGDDIEVTNLLSGSHTFSDIHENHTVEVVCKPCYQITTSIDHGTITEDITKIMPGSERTVTWSADAGYFVQSVTIDGKAQDVTDYSGDSYTFSDIQKDHTVDVVCAPCYTITTEIIHGTITDSMTGIMPGLNKEVTWRAENDYYVESVLVDGRPVDVTNDIAGSYSFENIQANHTVKVVCHPYYHIDTSIDHGTITPRVTELKEGASSRIEWSPAAGYYVTSLEVDGRPVYDSDKKTSEAPLSYAFENISDNHAVVVRTKKVPELTIRKTANQNAYYTDEDVVYSIVVQQTVEDAEATNVVVTDKDLPSGLFFDLDSIQVSAGAGKATVHKMDNAFSVTLDRLGYGETFTVSVHASMKNDELGGAVLVNRASVTSNQTESMESDVTSPLYYKVTTEVVHGQITSSDLHVARHSDKTISYRPENGYYLASVQIDGKEVSVTKYADTVSFEDVTENHSVRVLYKKIPALSIVKTSDRTSYHHTDTIQYTIRVKETIEDAVAENVVITDDDLSDGLVFDKSMITTTKGTAVNRADGFEVHVGSLAWNDEDVVITVTAKETELADSHVTNTVSAVSDQTKPITATAEADMFYRVDTEVEHGSITPSDEQVAHGSDKSIVYQPDDGYYLEQLFVDGKKTELEGHESGYVFENVTDDHAIKAVFRKIPHLMITKTSDKDSYNYKEDVIYTITVAQTVEDAIADDVVITDKDVTKGLDFDLSTLSVNREDAVVTKGENSFEVRLAHMEYGAPAIITVVGHVNNESLESSDIRNTATAYSKQTELVEDNSDISIYYRVDTDIVHGTITPTDSEIRRGEDKTVTYQPDTGYFVREVVVDGNYVDAETYNKEFEFPDICLNHEIRVVCEKIPSVKITKTSDKKQYEGTDTIHYTVTVEQTVEDAVAQNVTVTDFGLSEGVTVLPDTIVCDDALATVEPDDFVLHLSDLPYGKVVTISYDAVIDADVLQSSEVKNSVSVNWKNTDSVKGSDETSHEVRVSHVITTDVTHGTITETQTDVGIGEDRTIAYEPDEGYYLDSVTVDGEPVSIQDFAEEYVFSDIRKNHTIEVVYEKIPALMVEKTTDKDVYEKEDTILYSILVKQTMEDAVAEDVVLTDTGMSEGVELDLSTITCDREGAIIQTGEGNEFSVLLGKMEYGDEVWVTVEGHIVNEAVAQDGGFENTAIVTDTHAPDASDTASAAVCYRIDTKVLHGRITKSVMNIRKGEDKTVAYEPDEGYALASVTVDGEEQDIQTIPAEYSFEDISDNHEVEVVYEKIPALAVVKKCDKELYSAGEDVHFAVELTNQIEDSVAKSVILQDFGMTKGLVMNDDLKVTVSDGVRTNLIMGDNGWTIGIPELAYGESVSVTFSAKISPELAGKEIRNAVNAICDGMSDSISSEAKANVKSVSAPKKSIMPKLVKHVKQIREKISVATGVPEHVVEALFVVGFAVFGLLIAALVVFIRRRRR